MENGIINQIRCELQQINANTRTNTHLCWCRRPSWGRAAPAGWLRCSLTWAPNAMKVLTSAPVFVAPPPCGGKERENTEKEKETKGKKGLESRSSVSKQIRPLIDLLLQTNIVGQSVVVNVTFAFHKVKLNGKTRVTEKPREGKAMNDRDRKEETVIVICESPTCRGCCCSSHCSRSHSPSSESDVAGAPPLSEVEGQGDPLSAHCPETWAARPAQTPPPTPQPPSLPPLVTPAVRAELVPPREESPGAPEGERDWAVCCSPERSLSVG